MTSFLDHYHRYDFMAVTFGKDLTELSSATQTIVSNFEERLSVMLWVPIPTPGERMLEGRRLSLIGNAQRVSRAANPEMAKYVNTKSINKRKSLKSIGASFIHKTLIAETNDGTPTAAMETNDKNEMNTLTTQAAEGMKPRLEQMELRMQLQHEEQHAQMQRLEAMMLSLLQQQQPPQLPPRMSATASTRVTPMSMSSIHLGYLER